MNYDRNRLYFFPPSPEKFGMGWLGPLGIGIILCLTGLATQTTHSGWARNEATSLTGIGWCAVALIGGGIIWLLINIGKANVTFVTDEEYDEAVKKRFKEIEDSRQAALDKLGLDETQVQEVPSIFSHGYRSDHKTAEKIGKDGRLRTSQYDATSLFFSDTQVYVYQQIFDMLDGTKLEFTQEYFYKDIMSFSTLIKTSDQYCNPAWHGSDVRGVTVFYLKVPNDEFYCSLDKFSCSINGVQTDVNANAIIGAVKQKLREMKKADIESIKALQQAMEKKG